jgi:hypothetical protein
MSCAAIRARDLAGSSAASGPLVCGRRATTATAWLSAAIAAGCLLALGRILTTLMAPFFDAVMPMNCGSGIDCALQTVNFLH